MRRAGRVVPQSGLLEGTMKDPPPKVNFCVLPPALSRLIGDLGNVASPTGLKGLSDNYAVFMLSLHRHHVRGTLPLK